jgi:hypothetical protein
MRLQDLIKIYIWIMFCIAQPEEAMIINCATTFASIVLHHASSCDNGIKYVHSGNILWGKMK